MSVSYDEYGYVRGSREQYLANLKRCGISYPNPYVNVKRGATNGK